MQRRGNFRLQFNLTFASVSSHRTANLLPLSRSTTCNCHLSLLLSYSRSLYPFLLHLHGHLDPEPSSKSLAQGWPVLTSMSFLPFPLASLPMAPARSGGRGRGGRGGGNGANNGGGTRSSVGGDAPRRPCKISYLVSAYFRPTYPLCLQWLLDMYHEGHVSYRILCRHIFVPFTFCAYSDYWKKGACNADYAFRWHRCVYHITLIFVLSSNRLLKKYLLEAMAAIWRKTPHHSIHYLPSPNSIWRGKARWIRQLWRLTSVWIAGRWATVSQGPRRFGLCQFYFSFINEDRWCEYWLTYPKHLLTSCL